MHITPAFGNLPIELWAEVFLQLDLRWDLIYVTHVCSAWRTFSLGWPVLWLDLDLRNSRLPVCAEMMEELLPRTREAPVVLRVSLSEYLGDMPFDAMVQNRQTICRLVAEHMRHFRYLHLHGAVQDIVRNALLVPAPILQELSFLEDTIVAPSSCTLPENLFAGEAPNLRALDLGCNYLPDASPALSSVLTLNAGPGWREDSSLYAVLPRMVNLCLRSERRLPKQPQNRRLAHVELIGMGNTLKYLDRSNIQSLHLDNVQDYMVFGSLADGPIVRARIMGRADSLHCVFDLADGRRRVIRRISLDILVSPSILCHLTDLQELACSSNVLSELTLASWTFPSLERCTIVVDDPESPSQVEESARFIRRDCTRHMPSLKVLEIEGVTDNMRRKSGDPLS